MIYFRELALSACNRLVETNASITTLRADHGCRSRMLWSENLALVEA
jgi:hypothetical protein